MSIQRHPVATPHFTLPTQVLVAALLLLALATIIILAIDAATIPVEVAPAENPYAAELARLTYRRGEWNANTVSANAAERAWLDYRRGEWLAGGSAIPFNREQAYLNYRRGEWFAGGSATPIDRGQAYLNYRRGEWTGQ